MSKVKSRHLFCNSISLVCHTISKTTKIFEMKMILSLWLPVTLVSRFVLRWAFLFGVGHISVTVSEEDKERWVHKYFVKSMCLYIQCPLVVYLLSVKKIHQILYSLFFIQIFCKFFTSHCACYPQWRTSSSTRSVSLLCIRSKLSSKRQEIRCTDKMKAWSPK